MNRFEKERTEMIELLRQRGIKDELLLKAMQHVEREQFVLPAFMIRAYDDSALPIANGQTISQPYTVAFQTERLQVGKDSKVLEIGTGSGYQTAILATLAIPSYVSAIKHARESVLKEDLHVLRAAIDSYTMDKQKAPQSLEDLIQDGYLREVPVDPFTHTKDSWVTATSDSMHSLDQTEPGIDDVHSGSQDTGSDGQAYSTW